jgi:hypothetical protein
VLGHVPFASEAAKALAAEAKAGAKPAAKP